MLALGDQEGKTSALKMVPGPITLCHGHRNLNNERGPPRTPAPNDLAGASALEQIIQPQRRGSERAVSATTSVSAHSPVGITAASAARGAPGSPRQKPRGWAGPCSRVLTSEDSVLRLRRDTCPP